MDIKDMIGQAQALLGEARPVLEAPGDFSAEAIEQAHKKIEDAMELKSRVSQLDKIRQAGNELAEMGGRAPRAHGFQTLGQFVAAATTAGKLSTLMMGEKLDSRLRPYMVRITDKKNDRYERVYKDANNEVGWGERKDLAESVGATGGFLVPEEFIPELYGVDPERNTVRGRATIIPMMGRQVRLPRLNQTGTTAGQPHMFGGITANWTEEGTTKTETDPSFGQTDLVAHKLVCYTEISDELIADSAISLEGFLRGPMGFAGAVAWTEEYAFLRGTGVGQPLGVINAGATITVNRNADGAFQLEDAAHMLEHFYGRRDRAVWMMSQSVMSELLTMNGPAANPSYVFVANANGSPTMTLLGIPVIFTEKLPLHGTTGDVVLADFGYYLIGDRQGVVIESTDLYKFKEDQTSFRAVHRVGGMPWLSQYLTLADGTSTVSPFVILGEKAS